MGAGKEEKGKKKGGKKKRGKGRKAKQTGFRKTKKEKRGQPPGETVNRAETKRSLEDVKKTKKPIALINSEREKSGARAAEATRGV